MSSPNTSGNPLSSIPLGVDLSSVFDGFYYGYTIALVLFGVTIVQTWIYLNINRDKWHLRCLVGFLFLLDFATICLDSAAIHHYLVSNFGNLFNLTTLSRLTVYEGLLTFIIIFCVQIFFAARVYLIRSFHWIVPLLIVLTAIGTFAAGLSSIVDQYRHPLLTRFESRGEKLRYGVSLSLSSCSDIIATGALSWTFSRNKNGIKKTDTLLQKLLQYTVTRGLLVTVTQIILLILILVKPLKLWWVPFHLSLSKIYIITMVSMLNYRETLRSIASSGVITYGEVSGMSRSTRSGGDVGVSVSKTSHSAINFAAFPTGSQGEGQEDDLIEMDDYEKHGKGEGVIVTRERTSEVV